MNTWTSRVCLTALVCLIVAGCDEGIVLPGDSSKSADALLSAELGRGAITLVAPQGFCIDPRSLRARFALMARCDTLGAAGAEDAPLALITATSVTATSTGPITAQELGAGAETVLERQEVRGVTLIRVQGTPPGPGLRDTYWRAARRIGTQIVGLAIYEGTDATRLGPRAPRLLEQTMQRTEARSVTADNSATPVENNPRAGFLSGLFE